MATPSRDVPTPSVRKRRGPRHSIGSQYPAEGSDDLLFFRDLTRGLSTQLAIPNLEAQRAGTAQNPITMIRRLLLRARALGLTKEWALRLHVYIGRTIDSLWPQCQTATDELERREMAAEHVDDAAEKRLDLNRDCPDAKRARIASLTAEIAHEKVVLARHVRELEQLEAGR